MMLKIGITGGIGSGKSTVSRIFEMLGVPVFYADQAAKAVMVSDELLINGIRERFGAQAYDEAGQLNRKLLADRVFSDEKELDALNKLVHPAVFRAFDYWLTMQKAPYVLKEAAILFESGSYKLCDKSIVVIAPLETRIARVCKRDQVSAEDVKSRIDKQISQDQAITLADFLIENDEQHLLIPQVLALHKQFLSLV